MNTLREKYDWFMNTFTGMDEYNVYSMYIFRDIEKNRQFNIVGWLYTFTKSLHSIHQQKLTIHGTVHKPCIKSKGVLKAWVLIKQIKK